MTTLIKEVYDAFRAAGTPEEQAAAAAQAIAGYENRFANIERDLLLLKWMVGVNTAGIVVIIGLILVLLRGP